MDRLQARSREQDWDLVIGLTELPLHDSQTVDLIVATAPLVARGEIRIHSSESERSQVLATIAAGPAAAAWGEPTGEGRG